jgi:predicted aspartyl protease
VQLQLRHNLPFVSITAEYNDRRIVILPVLVDTGSASTILSIDELSKIGINPEPNDSLQTIRGIGGTEVVFKRKLQNLGIDETILSDFNVEIGAMDYGFEINGILGMGFLLNAGIILDLHRLQISTMFPKS